MPACRLVIVFLPITLSGLTSSKLGSLEVPRTSASLASLMPGQMQPPTNAPFSSTTPKVVAVPKSMKMHGAP